MGEQTSTIGALSPLSECPSVDSCFTSISVTISLFAFYASSFKGILFPLQCRVSSSSYQGIATGSNWSEQTLLPVPEMPDG